VKQKKIKAINELKKDAWDLLSKIVRLRQSNDWGFGFCVTCFIDKGEKTQVSWKTLQAGHYQSGRGNSILFDERGIRPQCFGCNMRKQGNTNAFLIYLEREIGKEAAHRLKDELHVLSRKPRQFARYELEGMIENYTLQLKRMGGI